MGDVDRNSEASLPVTVVGGDEQFAVDVIQEDGFNKILAKTTTVPDQLEKLLFNKALNGGSSDLNVNGSGTPQVFIIDAPLVGQKDAIYRELRFSAFDNGVKIDTFLGQNSELTNGILVELITNGNISPFLDIKNTAEFESHFAFGNGGKFDLIFSSGSDFMTATFSPLNPFKLVAGSNDKIQVTIRDNLLNISFLEFIAFGFEDN